MALGPRDAYPHGITLREAYAAIRQWYRAAANTGLSDERQVGYLDMSRDYIESMPRPEVASRDVMIDYLKSVISNRLEFGYHESDGQYKMGAYASAGLEDSASG